MGDGCVQFSQEADHQSPDLGSIAVHIADTVGFLQYESGVLVRFVVGNHDNGVQYIIPVPSVEHGRPQVDLADGVMAGWGDRFPYDDSIQIVDGYSIPEQPAESSGEDHIPGGLIPGSVQPLDIDLDVCSLVGFVELYSP